jgi:hypothetical protein
MRAGYRQSVTFPQHPHATIKNRPRDARPDGFAVRPSYGRINILKNQAIIAG